MARATIQASNVHGSNGGEVTAVRERGVAAKKNRRRRHGGRNTYGYIIIDIGYIIIDICKFLI